MTTKQDFKKVLDASDKSVATFQNSHRSPIEKLQSLLHSYPIIVPFMILLVGIICFTIVTDGRFLSLYNLNITLQRVSIIGTLAAAQTLIVLTAGIDLSVGALMIFSSMAMGHLALSGDNPLPAFIAVGLGIAIAGLAGLFNGLLITRIKLPPFIATLGTWRIFFALIFILFGSQSFRGTDIDASAPLLKFWGTLVSIGPLKLTTGSILLVFIFAIIWYMLNKTAWGRHVYAVGDDKEAADLAGIRTDSTLLSVYCLAGLICGLAAWMSIGRIGSISPTSFAEANLESITAVVIGGISLFGGRGSIIGVFMGALIVQVFDAGLGMTDLDPQAKYLVLGLLIIIAVAIDQWIRKVSA